MISNLVRKVLVSAVAAGMLFVGAAVTQPGTAHADGRREWREHHRGGGPYYHGGYGWHGRHDAWRYNRGGGPYYYGHPYYRPAPAYPNYNYGRPYHPGPHIYIAP